MDVLVMGGTEFVSEAMAKFLISKNYTVDILTRGFKPVSYSGFRNHLVADRKSKVELQRVISKYEYDYVFDITAYTKEEVEILTSVLNRNKLKRYIFCSTGGVYVITHDRIKEDYEKIKVGEARSYISDKKAAEDYLLKLRDEESFPITIFRPSYIYGEGNNLYREAYLFDRITNNLPIPIPHGNNSRVSYVLIDDLVRLFESAIHSEESLGKAYNATNDEAVGWEYLVEAAMEVVGKKTEIVKVDTTRCELNSVKYFPYYDYMYIFNNDNVKGDGLEVPGTSLKEGLRIAYDWYCRAKPKLKSSHMDMVEEVIKEYR